jgi:hypothetical protein
VSGDILRGPTYPGGGRFTVTEEVAATLQHPIPVTDPDKAEEKLKTVQHEEAVNPGTHDPEAVEKAVRNARGKPDVKQPATAEEKAAEHFEAAYPTESENVAARVADSAAQYAQIEETARTDEDQKQRRDVAKKTAKAAPGGEKAVQRTQPDPKETETPATVHDANTPDVANPDKTGDAQGPAPAKPDRG